MCPEKFRLQGVRSLVALTTIRFNNHIRRVNLKWGFQEIPVRNYFQYWKNIEQQWAFQCWNEGRKSWKNTIGRTLVVSVEAAILLFCISPLLLLFHRGGGISMTPSPVWAYGCQGYRTYVHASNSGATKTKTTSSVTWFTVDMWKFYVSCREHISQYTST